MVLYLCVLIVFSLHRESLKLILAMNPSPRWFCHTNLCKVYNYHDTCAYSYKRSGILSRLVGFECGMVWFEFGLACMESYDL
jgi:hypothetical protein